MDRAGALLDRFRGLLEAPGAVLSPSIPPTSALTYMSTRALVLLVLYSIKSWQRVHSTVGLELVLLGRFSAGGMFADHPLISSSPWPIDDHGDEGHIVQRVTAWERHMVWELGPC